jgi:integrase
MFARASMWRRAKASPSMRRQTTGSVASRQITGSDRRSISIGSMSGCTLCQLSDRSGWQSSIRRRSRISGTSYWPQCRALTSLKSVLKVANYSQVAASVTISSDKRNKPKLEAGVDIPTPGEIRRLIDAATNAKVRALLLTAALTGLRASELRGLRWSDVDLRACELHVRQRASRYCEIGAPKSESSRRTVPIEPEILLPALKAWKLACPLGELVFPTADGRIAHHEQLLRALAPVMTAAGVVDKAGKPKYALHAFRHFFASWCINPQDRGGRGLSAKVVQGLLGHSSIVMTLDVYGHLFARGDDQNELTAAAKRLLLG